MAVRSVSRLSFSHGRYARRARAFCADRSGATALEFAIIVVPFLALIGSIFEVGFAHFRTAQLQTVAEAASRALLTNKTILAPGATQITHKQFVQNYVCTWKSNGGTVERGTLDRMFNCDDVFVQLDVISMWNRTPVARVRIVNQDQPIARLPGPGEIGVLKVFYRYRMSFSILALDDVGALVKVTPTRMFVIDGRVQDQNVYVLSGYAAFRVEPAG